jgi:hypothetical protein
MSADDSRAPTGPDSAAAGTPQRIQRKWTKGWKMPTNAVYVGRPTKWGNPWTPKAYWDAGYSGSLKIAASACVQMYKAWLTDTRCSWSGTKIEATWPQPSLAELRGKDLACWCPLDQRCHADVLLELANE